MLINFDPFEIANFEGNLQLSNFDQPFYLQYKTDKFWEISLKENKTEINFGKLKKGKKFEKQCFKREQIHESNDIAKQFLIDKIGFKRVKGYNLRDYDEIEIYDDSQDKESQASQEGNQLVRFTYGSNDDKNKEEENNKEQNIYFEKQLDYVQLETLWPVVKVMKGKTNQKKESETNYFQFGNKSDIMDYIKNLKNELQLKGFLINNTKLKPTLSQEEIADYKQKLSQQLKQQYSGSKQKQNAPQIFVHQATKDLPDSEEEEKRPASDKPQYLQVANQRQNRFKNNSVDSLDSSLSDLTDQIRSRSRSLSKSPDKELTSNTGSVLGPSKQGTISVMLAQKYEDNQVDPKGYYMSEKLDGVTGMVLICFNHTIIGHKMYSRNGNEFFCPKWFTRGWPQSQLDGELWTNRNEFEACVKIVRQQNPVDEQWKKITYLVFDAPGLKTTFKERYEEMKKEFDKLALPHLQLVPNILCKGQEHLEEELKKVEAKKGEGLMLKNPDSYYQNKRSYDLLKVKSFHDEEAVVIGYKPGKGQNSRLILNFKHTKVGQLEHCKQEVDQFYQTNQIQILDDAGIEFYVGSGLTDQDRRHPPKKGTKITYKYQNLTNSGKPRFPTFQRLYQNP